MLQQHTMILSRKYWGAQGKETSQGCLSYLHSHLQAVYAGQCADSSLTTVWTDGVSNIWVCSSSNPSNITVSVDLL